VAVHTYLVADLATNRILAEVPLTTVRYGKKLGGTGQVSATLNLGDPRVQAEDPADLTTPARRVVYVLRDDVPVWGGLVWTRRYDSANQRISLGCGDFWSYYDHRKVLLKLDPAKYTDLGYIAHLDPVDLEEMDQNEIARRLIAGAALHDGGDIGVIPDATMSGVITSRAYFGFQNVSVGDALRKLSQVAGGPDMYFDVGPLDAAGRPSRRLRLGDPSLGQQGSPHVWEFGGNMVSYTWPSDGTRMATRVFADGSGFESVINRKPLTPHATAPSAPLANKPKQTTAAATAAATASLCRSRRRSQTARMAGTRAHSHAQCLDAWRRRRNRQIAALDAVERCGRAGERVRHHAPRVGAGALHVLRGR